MIKSPVRIAINGFGRIGRTILRQALDDSDIDVVLINDIAPIEIGAYLFEYDSVFGRWPGMVEVGEDNITVDCRKLRFTNTPKLEQLDLRSVDVVLECTGSLDAAARAKRYLDRGASRVLISGPSQDADVTLIVGANEDRYSGERIVSNGSCTTNALAPLLAVLDRLFTVRSGQMTTVHCYTGSQPTIDQPMGDMARSRAAALSMVPTTTSAHRLLSGVLPRLAGLIQARAIRVPTASVSAIDLTVLVEDGRAHEDIASVLKAEVKKSPVLGWTEKPLVSVDLRGRSESLVISAQEVSLAPNGLLRVFGWYDNEWAFARRMLDMAQHLVTSSKG
jgi:glyceraldehyde 3-phosphate dehydrogenase